MARILYNKNVLAPSAVTQSVFTTGMGRFGEIVICNDLNEPGIYIYTRGTNGETRIQKVNDVENIILKNDIDMTITGDVVSGDTLEQIVSKLQNQSIDNRTNIASEEERATSAETFITNNVSNLSGTTFVLSAGTVHEVERLDERINTEINDTMAVVSGFSASTMQEIERVDNTIASFSSSTMSEVERVEGVIANFSAGTESEVSRIDNRITDEIADLSASTVNEVNRLDLKIENAIDALDMGISLPEGQVFTTITEDNGVVSGVSKSLTIAKDETGLVYDLKLGDYVFGRIDIPQDQFLSGVTFITEATIADATEAYNAGQTIDLGKPYLKFAWILSGGVQSPTFVDVSSLIDIYNAKDIKLSEDYNNNEFGITSGKSLEEVVSMITDEMISIEADVTERSMSSSDKTVNIVKSSSGTNLEVNIDNDTIVKSELVSSLGVLSTSLSVDKTNYTSGNVKTKYTLRSKNGEYGVIDDTRDIVSGGKFVNITTGTTIDDGGVRTDTVDVSLTTQDVIQNVQGPDVEDSNGLVTAWGIKNYVTHEVNGHVIMVGDQSLIEDRDYEYWRGKVNFNELSADYDSIHGALTKLDNNFQVIDETIGLPISGRSVHQYPSAMTENATVIKDDRTIMDALVSLDTAIGNMDWTGTTTENEVFSIITQADGKISAGTRNISSVKIADYVVGGDAKVTSADTIGQAFGKLQGQIDALDYSATTDNSKVFTYIKQNDGKLTLSAENITNRVLTDYAVGSDAKIAESDTLGGALGKVQGQINGMNKAASSASGRFVRTVSESSGKVSETLGYILSSDISIVSAASSNVNVKEAWKLVNGQGTQLGQTINIYKDQTLKSVVLSGDSSTVGQWLVFTYILSGGTESKVAVDVSKFLVQAEFTGGVKANSAGIVSGVVDSTSESFLTVGANGFKLSGVQTAINTAASNAVNGLDSETSNVTAGYVLTKVAIKDGKISGRTQVDLINSATTASKLDGTTKSGLFTAFTSPSSATTAAPETSITVGGTEKKAKVNADMVDGYHIVVGTSGTAKNTIYIL